MSIALPSLPTAAVPLGPQPAAVVPAAQNAAATNAQLPGFQSAWQRIALAGALQTTDTADTALAAAEDDTSSDTDATPGRTISDLMLSGMLLPPSGLALAQPDQSASVTITAGASATSATASAASASANKLGASLASIAHSLPAVAPTAAPAMTASPQASNSLLEKLVQNTAAPNATKANTANTADSPEASAALPARPMAIPAALAALTASADAGRQQQAASRVAALDLQDPDSSSTATAIDNAARDIQRSSSSTTPTTNPTTSAHRLLASLGERISLQLQRGSERAVIRLDPPMQGQLEITIRHDATGATQIHLSASNSDVVRQLQTLSDSLRQELIHRQAGEVTVVVSQSGRDQDGRQRQNPQTASQQAPGRALADDADAPARFTLSPA